MVVQTTQKEAAAFNYVQIPQKVPKEILENDSLLILEKDLNTLEDRVVITARTVLGMNYELQTQIKEIVRVENAISSMHEFMMQQQHKIDKLEKEVTKLKKTKFSMGTDNNPESGFWARLFSK
jgi:hypothetical protein